MRHLFPFLTEGGALNIVCCLFNIHSFCLRLKFSLFLITLWLKLIRNRIIIHEILLYFSILDFVNAVRIHEMLFVTLLIDYDTFVVILLNLNYIQ